MPKQIMTRNASDNVYLHKDFHGALSNGIEYLDQNYGEEAVREYLHDFTRSYYAPLIKDIEFRGLVALKEHFESIYTIEEGRIIISMTEDDLTLKVAACPAVTHMREHDYAVARLWIETERSVNAALCEGTPFDYELLEYDPKTGRSTQCFFRRSK